VNASWRLSGTGHEAVRAALAAIARPVSLASDSSVAVDAARDGTPGRVRANGDQVVDAKARAMGEGRIRWSPSRAPDVASIDVFLDEGTCLVVNLRRDHFGMTAVGRAV